MYLIEDDTQHENNTAILGADCIEDDFDAINAAEFDLLCEAAALEEARERAEAAQASPADDDYPF